MGEKVSEWAIRLVGWLTSWMSNGVNLSYFIVTGSLRFIWCFMLHNLLHDTLVHFCFLLSKIKLHFDFFPAGHTSFTSLFIASLHLHFTDSLLFVMLSLASLRLRCFTSRLHCLLFFRCFTSLLPVALSVFLTLH